MEETVTAAPAAPAATLSLSPAQYEIAINVSPVEEEEYLVEARLRRPTLDEDCRFTEASAAEFLEVGNGEEQLLVSDKPALKFFDEICTEVRGYRFAHEPESAAQEWRGVDEDLRQVIPGSHKAAFVRNMRSSTAKYVGSTLKGGFVLGGASETLPVELTIGTKKQPLGVVRFEVPAPTEGERLEFEHSAMRFLQGVAGDQRRNRTVTDLRKCAEFFDTLMQREGARISDTGTINGKPFSACESAVSRFAFLKAIDPTIKAKVVSAALVKYSARLRV